MVVVGQMPSFGTIGVNLLYDEAERYHEAFAIRGGLKLEKLVAKPEVHRPSIRFAPSTSCHTDLCHRKTFNFLLISESQASHYDGLCLVAATIQIVFAPPLSSSARDHQPKAPAT